MTTSLSLSAASSLPYMDRVSHFFREGKGWEVHELRTTGRGYRVVVGDPLPAQPDRGFFRGGEAEIFGHGGALQE